MMMTRIVAAGIAPQSPIYDAEVVEFRLEEAGATLLALPSKGCLPAGYRSNWPEVLVDAAEAYGYGPITIRAPIPSARKVTRMDEAFAWLKLMPLDRINHRRIVLLRSLTNPITGRHKHSWRAIGQMFGWDYRAVQRWHAEAIGWIVGALYTQQCAGSEWARLWHEEREGPDSLARRAAPSTSDDLGKGMRTSRW